MKCGNCGNELTDGDVFCGNCGSCVQNANSQCDYNYSNIQEEQINQYCDNCGAMLNKDEIFCHECGQPLTTEVSASDVKKRKTPVAVIIIIILVAVIAALVSVIIGYVYDSETKNNDIESELYATTAPTGFASELPTESPTKLPSEPITTMEDKIVQPTEEVITSDVTERQDLYSSSLTYKRMPEIHNTILSNDTTFNEIKDVILDFNNQCYDYMNRISSVVPTYLRKGTTAYNQQVEHKNSHPTLEETYLETDVINAREGGGYYYVWVTEVIDVTENGISSIQTEHWVYKLEKINSTWYINDYTRDPLYN